jgi:hypothetical protein
LSHLGWPLFLPDPSLGSLIAVAMQGSIHSRDADELQPRIVGSDLVWRVCVVWSLFARSE